MSRDTNGSRFIDGRKIYVWTMEVCECFVNSSVSRERQVMCLETRRARIEPEP